jgi:hypothetical protein
MYRFRFIPNRCSRVLTASLLFTASAGDLLAQAPPASAPGASTSTGPQNWTTQQDHKNMMEQLGNTKLPPGRSPRADSTNAANFDPARANPFPNLPNPLTLNDGRKVTTTETWWKLRRPEIVEDFEHEVVGRVPKSVPSSVAASNAKLYCTCNKV